MYFNNIHILVYLIVGFIGCAVGQMVGILNDKLIDNEKILEKGFFKKLRKGFVPYYKLMIIMFILYIALLFMSGIDNNWHTNIRTLSYFILMPLLVSAFVIDIKKQIIPNRLVLIIFEIGLLITFFEGIMSPTGLTFALNRIEGMVCGVLIFSVITLLGGLIAGKEAMGMGDVKLMGAIGLFFGLSSVVIISVISFLIGAIVSIILLLKRIKKSDEYIPFGPFIVISVIIAMLIPEEILTSVLWYIFSAQWLLGNFMK